VSYRSVSPLSVGGSISHIRQLDDIGTHRARLAFGVLARHGQALDQFLAAGRIDRDVPPD
jgi:hypothetical protein